MSSIHSFLMHNSAIQYSVLSIHHHDCDASTLHSKSTSLSRKVAAAQRVECLANDNDNDYDYDYEKNLDTPLLRRPSNFPSSSW